MVPADKALLKVQLYLELMKIPPEEMSEADVDLLFLLSKDNDIRERLSQGCA